MSVAAMLYYWVALVLASLVLGNPLSLLYLMIFTLGTGVYFVSCLVNFTAYYTLALPGLIISKHPRFRLTGRAAAIFLPLLVALPFAYLESSTAKQEAEAQTVDDFSGTLKKRPQSVALRNTGDITVCHSLCLRLLAGGYTDSVIVAPNLNRNRTNVPAPMRYSLSQAACATQGNDPKKSFYRQSDTLMALKAKGLCLKDDAVYSSDADAVFKVDYGPRSGVRIFTVESRGEVLHRSTQVSYQALAFPLMLWPKTYGLHGFLGSWLPYRPIRFVNKLDFDTAVLARFPPLEPDQALIAEATYEVLQPEAKRDFATRTLQTFADRDTRLPFTRDEVAYIRQWSNDYKATDTEWREREDSAVRLFLDPRLRDKSTVVGAFRRRPKLTQRFASELLEYVEHISRHPEDAASPWIANNIAYLLLKLPDDRLGLLENRVRQLIGVGTPAQAGLLAMAARLDISVFSLIRQGLTSRDRKIAKLSEIAACELPEQQVRELMVYLKEPSPADGKVSRTRLAALIRIGEVELAASLTGGKDRLKMMNLDHTGPGFPAQECGRWQ